MSTTTKWRAAAKKATVWGTAVAFAAGDGLKLESESLSPGIAEPIKDENVGDSLSGGMYQGNVTAEGNLVLPVRYLGFERLASQFMGEDVVTELEAAEVGEHAMRFLASNTGKFVTIGLDKDVGVHEYPTAKLGSLELAHNNGKLVATFGAVANRCERAAPENDAAAILAATPPTQKLLVLFTQLDVLLKEVTGAEGNLAAPADRFKVSDARFSANRNLSGDVVSGANGEIDEPETDGLPEAELVLNFPRYTTALDALITQAQRAQTAREPKVYKASLVWTGPGIPATAPAKTYSLKLDLPELVLVNAPTNAGGPGAKVPVEMTFAVRTPGAAGNGTDWAWVVAGQYPFRLVLVNTNVTSAA